MNATHCFHCGNECKIDRVRLNNHDFCCNGCKTVYEILNANDLTCYYDFEEAPGAIPTELKGKYDYLDNDKIVEKLYDFIDNDIGIITFYIPHIHCSSCIWVLENLEKLNGEIVSSQVNFPKKEVRITFKKNRVSLKKVVELLSSIGYEPYISLEDTSISKSKANRSLIYKLGVAFFAFGNIMLLSFPEYFQSDGVWLDRYKPLFRIIIFITALPVVLYAANDYFISAYKGLKHKMLNIDVPIALGISVLFLRSTFEFFINNGQGYFDSLAGFVFFLLLGKIFQQQTYRFLSFERDYKSYFPIAVTKVEKGSIESTISIHEIQKGDRLLIRNNELIPVDGILISGNSQIDYSFVTGESFPVSKMSGDNLFAGGKQLSGSIEMEVLKSVSQSYLTQLWSNDVFTKKQSKGIKNITDSISKQFTIIVLFIAFLSGIIWYFIDTSMVANVVTAVLIIACPCALALSAPFALGNMLRIFGKQKIYLKNTDTIEHLAKIDTLIFDKTGTITTKKAKINYSGKLLSHDELTAIKSLLRASNHPLSRLLYEHIQGSTLKNIERFKEVLGQGLEGIIEGKYVKIGAASFVNSTQHSDLQTVSYISIDGKIKGKYIFENSYRDNLAEVFEELNTKYELGILSGDNAGERQFLEKILPQKTLFVFNQKPDQKLNYIKQRQENGSSILMIGDGLNDVGALAQSDVGMVISENINVFSPASDGIVDASKFRLLPKILKLSHHTIQIIKWSFLLSFLYNFIGMLFAVTGNLSPLVAAILMPLSSISIVIFVTLSTNFIANKGIE